MRVSKRPHPWRKRECEFKENHGECKGRTKNLAKLVRNYKGIGPVQPAINSADTSTKDFAVPGLGLGTHLTEQDMAWCPFQG